VSGTIPYRTLAGVVGLLFVAGGFGAFALFFLYQEPGSTPRVPTGPMGHYFVAATGCALVAWGGALLNSARRPELATALVTPTALALTLMAVYRMTAWVVGDYYLTGDLLRIEAGVFLLLALAFLWARPSVIASPVGAAGSPNLSGGS
jgi:hypothetical protein